MSDQRGFRNDGTESTGPRKSNDGDDQMKKKSEDVAHGRIVSNPKGLNIQGNWGIRHMQGLTLATGIETIKRSRIERLAAP